MRETHRGLLRRKGRGRWLPVGYVARFLHGGERRVSVGSRYGWLAIWILGAAAAARAAPPTDQASIGRGSSPSPQSLCETLSPQQAKIKIGRKRFDLRRPEDLRRLEAALDEEIKAVDAMRASKKHSGAHPRESGKSPVGRPEASADRPEAYGKDSDERPNGSIRKALAEMNALAARALASDRSPCEELAAIAEISDSLALDTKRPVPRRLDLVQVPIYYLDLLHNPVAVGKETAWNLPPNAASTPDPSLVDPLPSTFWTRPKDIASRDIYHEFGPILKIGDEVCTYDEPKTSYGTTPGFSIKCGEKIIKVKFGSVEFGKESSTRDSEAAVTRLFGALGYHVEPNDYAPEIRVRYDRRILLEFNSRKDLTLTITVFGFIPIYRINVQSMEDPFQYIRSAVMKDGRSLSPDALAERLIRREVLVRSPRKAKKHPKGTLARHYRADAAAFEKEIDHLVMMEANIQARGSGGENIGRWGWDGLDHPSRRELRGAGLLSAWTNYFDARWDNNRLKFVVAKRNREDGDSEDTHGEGDDKGDHGGESVGGGAGGGDDSGGNDSGGNDSGSGGDSSKGKTDGGGDSGKGKGDGGGEAGRGKSDGGGDSSKGKTDGGGGGEVGKGKMYGGAGRGSRVRHFISDLGSGLGRAENFRVVAGSRVNDFPWTFTEGPVKNGKGRGRPFRIVGYKPIFDNGAFRDMTLDDARWMARLIAQLTENQLEQALIAAGYTSAEVKVYTEKLISRRDTMIKDLGLAGEIPLLRPNGIGRMFDYDPRKDGPIRATAADGSELRPIESLDLVVRSGRVEPR